MKPRLFPMILAAAGLIAFGAGCKKATTNTNTDDNANQAIVNTDDSLNSNLDINAILDDNSNLNTNSDLNTNSTDTTNSNANTNVSTNVNTGVSTNTNVNTNTSTNTNTVVSANSTIAVTAPVANAQLVSPFYVQGTAETGTSVFVRVRSAGGAPIFTESVSVSNRAFKGKLLFDFTSTKNGSVEVFQKDADGKEVNLVSVPVIFTLSSATNSNSSTNNNING